MTPSNGQATRKVTRTVFDLTAFDDVKLEKTVTLPTKPTTLEEALQAAGNDTAKLLDLIHEGLISESVETARADISGFKVVGEDGEATEPYDGKFADEEKGKKINAAIESLQDLPLEFSYHLERELGSMTRRVAELAEEIGDVRARLAVVAVVTSPDVHEKLTAEISGRASGLVSSRSHCVFRRNVSTHSGAS